MGRGEESSKSRGIGADPKHRHHQPRYGTFQDSSSYSQPAIGFPTPNPTLGASGPPYYTYEALPGAEGEPVSRLPCCGIGIGWFLFIIGFFLAAVPWCIGALILMCGRVDYREKRGYAACTVAAIIAVISVFIGVAKCMHAW